MKTNYNKLKEITVESQQELNDIPADFEGRIYIEFGTPYDRAVVDKRYKLSVEACGNSCVEACGNSSIVAREDSSVVACGNSSIVARENSSIVACGNSSVVARENSSVMARENSSVMARENNYVMACGNSSVMARENSSVEARENSSVEAWGNSSVEAWGNSSVEACGNSSVVARENSSVVARENSSVMAWGNSSVVAQENSSVEACGNSSVMAWGNSSIVACGNVQIVDFLQGSKTKIAGNARIIYNPKSIIEFMDFYGIKYTKTTATFYKAVHKYDDGTYHADYSCSFDYVIGQSKTVSDIDKSTLNDCGEGINISNLAWAVDFGKNWSDLAILEVKTKIDNIVLPINTDGKVRTSEVKVIREVPLKECGLYGKILAKRASQAEKNLYA